jgi:hypothetical protein
MDEPVCPIPKRSAIRDRICVPMKCAVCEKCCALLSRDGKPTGYCQFGGPFAGYAHAKP